MPCAELLHSFFQFRFQMLYRENYAAKKCLVSGLKRSCHVLEGRMWLKQMPRRQQITVLFPDLAQMLFLTLHQGISLLWD